MAGYDALPHRNPGAGYRPARGVERRRWEVRGTVQGVGFRSFVHRLAHDLHLAGKVRHHGGTLVIDAEGPGTVLDVFEQRLRAETPPLADVTALIELPPSPEARFAGFVVEESRAALQSGPGHRDVPPDAAICDACLTELYDPAGRRFRYPFINCLDCGPRATIIAALPYDRAASAMERFVPCPECVAEYRDPASRRFHDEAVSCPACGPRLSWRGPGDAAVCASGDAALTAAAACIEAGGITALKGQGGYQLVCDATNDTAVAALRERKNSPAKPFPIMVENLHLAALYARLSTIEQHLLSSPARPVVLAWPHPSHHFHHTAPLASAVRAGAPDLGIFLPTTGLHHLLLRQLARPLAVTSGNLGGEPTLTDDEQAREQLATVADGMCAHERPVLARYDDSVTIVLGAVPSVLRRARGYAPAPLHLPTPAPAPLLAAGARLRHTFTLAAGPDAVTSTHLGDLTGPAGYRGLHAAVERLRRLHGIDPEYAAHDLEPDYLSTRYVRERYEPGRRVAVQHHHAHIASCAAEHDLTDDVIGVVYDAPALGDDGTLWGGEVMVANMTGYTRLCRFARAPLPGSASTITRPDQIALGYLTGLESSAGHGRLDPELVRRFTSRLAASPVRGAAHPAPMFEGPLASSAAALFAAAAAILGLRGTVSFEGEAETALEAAATGVSAPALAWHVYRDPRGVWVYDPAPTLTALLSASGDTPTAAHLAAAFHSTIAEVTVTLVRHAARIVGDRPVCLSGSVWHSRTLTTAVQDLLRAEGFDVFVNQRVPCNDGGISYGQAAIAAATLADR